MVRRALLGLMGVASCNYLWDGSVALCFGRYDRPSWEREHPAPVEPIHPLGPYRISVTDTRRIVPSAGLDREIDVQNANNNLHVVRHTDGRVYLAWRTAPTHFASERVVVNVASSTDEVNWRREATLSLGTDLREPQLLSLNGKLHLYVSKLGKNAFDFEPAGVQRSTRAENGAWSALTPLNLPGHIAWSVRAEGSRAMMSAYSGGENMYAIFPSPLRVRLLMSTDGIRWSPLNQRVGPLYEGGASETDFATTGSGRFLTVMRNEGGDETGFGSIVCERSAPSDQTPVCQSDPKKFDSPRLFRFKSETYLLARRNLTKSGVFDQPTRLFNRGPLRRAVNQLEYIVERKRCSLWRYLEKERRFAFEIDLPSRGDTCFASVIEGKDPSEMIVYDYSSAIDGPDVPWTVGQRAPTYIYRHVLKFDSAPSK